MFGHGWASVSIPSGTGGWCKPPWWHCLSWPWHDNHEGKLEKASGLETLSNSRSFMWARWRFRDQTPFTALPMWTAPQPESVSVCRCHLPQCHRPHRCVHTEKSWGSPVTESREKVQRNCYHVIEVTVGTQSPRWKPTLKLPHPQQSHGDRQSRGHQP